MRQKHKQILRKQSVTPTSTAAPSFPLAPPPAGAISSVTSHLSSSSSTLPAISQQLHSSTKDTTKPAKVCVCVYWRGEGGVGLERERGKEGGRDKRRERGGVGEAREEGEGEGGGEKSKALNF